MNNKLQTNFFRLPNDVVQHYLTCPNLNNMLVVSAGYREGANTAIGYRVYKDTTQEYFIKYCVKGEGWFETQGERQIIRTGDIILCKKHTEHQYGTSLKNPWSVFWVYFYSSNFEEVFNLFNNTSYQILQFGSNLTLENYFKAILDQMNYGYARPHILHATHLLLTAFSHIELEKDQLTQAYPPMFEDTLSFMNANLTNQVTIEQLSHRVHLSKDHFIKLFLKKYGYTPMDYFIRLKMQQACNSMVTTTDPMKQIAQSLGYDDYFYFSRVFKKKIGCSPKVYRQQYQS